MVKKMTKYKLIALSAIMYSLLGCGGAQFARMSRGHVSCSDPEVVDLHRRMSMNTWTAVCPNGRSYSCSQVFNGNTAPVTCTEIAE